MGEKRSWNKYKNSGDVSTILKVVYNSTTGGRRFLYLSVYRDSYRYNGSGGCLGSGLLEVGNQVVPVLLLLETAEGHLGAGDVLLGVLEVGEEGVVLPGDALLLVGVGVGVAVDGTGLAAEEAVQGRADLVAAVLLDGVALGATGLEEVGTLLSVSCDDVLEIF
jgi:hypothetical protein